MSFLLSMKMVSLLKVKKIIVSRLWKSLRKAVLMFGLKVKVKFDNEVIIVFKSR